MGFFDFVKDAGSSIFGGSNDIKDPTKPLSQHLRDHGISPDGLKFAFSGEGVAVSGTVPDQETREKIVTIIGNVKGVARVDDQLKVATSASGAQPTAASSSEADIAPGWTSRTYTVKSGDTLSAIAKAHYGDASRYPVIFEANKPMLKDPNKIYPGQVLRIPKV